VRTTNEVLEESGRPAAPSGWSMPNELRKRLRPWIDVDEVGMEGFWSWLDAVVPLLPHSQGAEDPIGTELEPDERPRRLALALTNCGRERARLTVSNARYFADNQLLAWRSKALEAALSTYRRAGQTVDAPRDDRADSAAKRYLPQ